MSYEEATERERAAWLSLVEAALADVPEAEFLNRWMEHRKAAERRAVVREFKTGRRAADGLGRALALGEGERA